MRRGRRSGKVIGDEAIERREIWRGGRGGRTKKGRHMHGGDEKRRLHP